MEWAGSPLVAPAKQSVVLGWVLAADASCSGLQLPEWLEGDTKALGPHGRSPGLQILIPETRTKDTCISPGRMGRGHSRMGQGVNRGPASLPGCGFLDPILTGNLPTEGNLHNLVRERKEVSM